MACGFLRLGRPASAPKCRNNTDTLTEKRTQILHVGRERSSCLSQQSDAFYKKLCPFVMDVGMGRLPGSWPTHRRFMSGRHWEPLAVACGFLCLSRPASLVKRQIAEKALMVAEQLAGIVCGPLRLSKPAKALKQRKDADTQENYKQMLHVGSKRSSLSP